MKHPISILPILALAAMGASACSVAQAKGPATRPALEVPQPPPRVVEPVTAEAPPTLEPVADLPPPTTTSPRPRSTASRETASREAPKPEPKPETPPPTESAPAPAPPNPAPQIRTPADNSETAKQVRDILDRANKGLSTVDYRVLSPQRKESYDTAKRFILQAEDAIKVSNFQFARYLADKAETLAKELQGR